MIQEGDVRMREHEDLAFLNNKTKIKLVCDVLCEKNY